MKLVILMKFYQRAKGQQEKRGVSQHHWQLYLKVIPIFPIFSPYSGHIVAYSLSFAFGGYGHVKMMPGAIDSNGDNIFSWYRK